MDNSLCIGSITLGALSFADFFFNSIAICFYNPINYININTNFKTL